MSREEFASYILMLPTDFELLVSLKYDKSALWRRRFSAAKSFPTQIIKVGTDC